MPTQSASLASVSPLDFELMRKEGADFELIDVRTPAEFRALHAESARNLPLDQFTGDALRDLAEQSHRRALFLICQKGGRGRTACDQLRACGAVNVTNIEGGTLAWEAAGLPVVRGKQAISLERQVRIAAGSIVFVGAALAWWVHPAFVGLSAFIGAGLVFSGVTDTCGMALMLARCPWNRA